jgi:hypothetical protein
MATLELPTRVGPTPYNYVVKLDGVDYMLDYYFNPRLAGGKGQWMIGLFDAQSNLLVGHVAVVATWPLFNRFKANGVPPGTIFCFDTSGQNKDPGQFDLGDRCRIFYIEAGT